MPDGFRGDNPKKYLTEVENALTQAESIHIKDPFINVDKSVIPPPSLPDRSANEKPPHPASTGHKGGHKTGIGDSTNIVVDEAVYYQALSQMVETDEALYETFLEVISGIEDMCENSYI
jgi:hypothetical protein